VVDTRDLCRFLDSLPVFSRQSIVKVHFLLLIHDAQGRTAGFHSGLGVVTVCEANSDTLRADAYAAGMFGIVIEEKAGLAARFALDVHLDRVGMVSGDASQRRAVG
jgi:hypothetical protein